jgi:hypothetical protein
MKKMISALNELNDCVLTVGSLVYRPQQLSIALGCCEACSFSSREHPQRQQQLHADRQPVKRSMNSRTGSVTLATRPSRFGPSAFRKDTSRFSYLLNGRPFAPCPADGAAEARQLTDGGEYGSGYPVLFQNLP